MNGVKSRIVNNWVQQQKNEGRYSIRINQQFRICFIWKDGHAYDVEITDYH